MSPWTRLLPNQAARDVKTLLPATLAPMPTTIRFHRSSVRTSDPLHTKMDFSWYSFFPPFNGVVFE